MSIGDSPILEFCRNIMCPSNRQRWLRNTCVVFVVDGGRAHCFCIPRQNRQLLG